MRGIIYIRGESTVNARAVGQPLPDWRAEDLMSSSTQNDAAAATANVVHIASHFQFLPGSRERTQRCCWVTVAF